MTEDSGSDYGSVLSASQHGAEAPLPYNKSTRTSFGRQTAWTRKPGMGISKQSQGSFLNFDEDTTPQPPASDKGASFGGA